jgi:2-iminobutanoate/2-iminopropanoate deaminase
MNQIRMKGMSKCEKWKRRDAAVSLVASEVIVLGNLICASVQVGSRSGEGSPRAMGIGEQTQQSLRMISALLEMVGSSWNCVVKSILFLAHPDDLNAVRESFSQFAGPRAPIRSSIEIAAVTEGVRMEICVVAIRNAGSAGSIQ